MVIFVDNPWNGEFSSRLSIVGNTCNCCIRRGSRRLPAYSNNCRFVAIKCCREEKNEVIIYESELEDLELLTKYPHNPLAYTSLPFDLLLVYQRGGPREFLYGLPLTNLVTS